MYVEAAVLALAGAAVAAPSASGGFSVQQVEGPLVAVSGLRAVRNAYLKYNGTLPPSLTSDASGAKQSGSVVATPEQFDRAYLSPVQIGTPAQTLNLDFDTGSSDLWVFSTLLSSAQQSGHTNYDPSKSRTSTRLAGETWDISYADGSGSSGVVYGDKVVIGGVSATGQSVEAATSVAASFASDVASDGLVGLGGKVRNTASPKQATPFFEHVQATLPSPLFTASLKKGAPGSYDFGFINASKHSGAITYTPIQRTSQGAGLYEFISTAYYVGQTKYTASIDAIADTGTSVVFLPQAIITNYYNQVPRSQNNPTAGGYIYPCSETLPSFSIVISGRQFKITASYLNYGLVGTINGENFCFGGLQPSTGLPFGILGDVFLKTVFAVFDVGNQRLGFATPK